METLSAKTSKLINGEWVEVQTIQKEKSTLLKEFNNLINVLTEYKHILEKSDKHLIAKYNGVDIATSKPIGETTIKVELF